MPRKPKTETSTFIIAVEYDPKRTDAESVAAALDTLLETALSTPGITDDYGGISVGEFYPYTQNPEHVPKPDLWFEINDEARPDAAPLKMALKEKCYGASVAALGDDGEPIGEVCLDYHDNVLQALVYEPAVDEPIHAHVFTRDVAARRRQA